MDNKEPTLTQMYEYVCSFEHNHIKSLVSGLDKMLEDEGRTEFTLSDLKKVEANMYGLEKANGM